MRPLNSNYQQPKYHKFSEKFHCYNNSPCVENKSFGTKKFDNIWQNGRYFCISSVKFLRKLRVCVLYIYRASQNQWPPVLFIIVQKGWLLSLSCWLSKKGPRSVHRLSFLWANTEIKFHMHNFLWKVIITVSWNSYTNNHGSVSKPSHFMS